MNKNNRKAYHKEYGKKWYQDNKEKRDAQKKEYIDSTYGQHYASDKYQATDVELFVSAHSAWVRFVPSFLIVAPGIGEKGF